MEMKVHRLYYQSYQSYLFVLVGVRSGQHINVIDVQGHVVTHLTRKLPVEHYTMVDVKTAKHNFNKVKVVRLRGSNRSYSARDYGNYSGREAPS